MKDTLENQSNMEKIVSYLLPATKNYRRQRDPRGGFKSAKSVAREIATKCVKRNVSLDQLKKTFLRIRISESSRQPSTTKYLEFGREDLRLLNGVGIDLKMNAWINFALTQIRIRIRSACKLKLGVNQ